MLNPSDLVFQEQILGFGAGGIVRQADLFGAGVAVKPTSSEGNELHREVDGLHRIRHPHIVTLLGVLFDRDQGVRIVTELCSGLSVQHRISAGHMTTEAGLVVSRQIASAVAYLHSKDYAHRDIKTGNVFLLTKSVADPYAKLGDFGSSRSLEPSAVSRPGNMTPDIGTWAYHAPEAAMSGSYGFPADVYSFGCFLLEILVNRPGLPSPYGPDEITEFLYRVDHPKALIMARNVDVARILDLEEDMAKINEVRTGTSTLVQSCWLQAEDRPTAQDIVSILKSAGPRMDSADINFATV